MIKDFTGNTIIDKNNNSILIKRFYKKEKDRASEWVYDCPICGNETHSNISNIKRGSVCSSCKGIVISRKKTKTNDGYVADLKIKNPFVKVVGKYINDWTKIYHECPVCHRTDWLVSPSNILHGTTMCSECNSSSNNSLFSEIAQQYLCKIGVAKKEFDIGYKQLSYYDLYIPSNNLLIEIQSEYHDNKKAQLKDYNKKIFAESNGYNFEYVDNRDINIIDFLQRFDNNVSWDKIIQLVDLSLLKVKKIVQLDINGNFIKIFEGGAKEIEQSNIASIASISRACNGNNFKSLHFSCGYLWYWYDDYITMSQDSIQCVSELQKEQYLHKQNKFLYFAKKNGEIICENNAVKLAERINSNPSLIIACVKNRRKNTRGYTISRECLEG